MKKAKLMLLGIGVFAIAGGALALKAQRTLVNNAYCNTSAQSGACTAAGSPTTYTAVAPDKFTLDGTGNTQAYNTFCTLVASDACDAVTTIYSGTNE
jgi:hypothetical protein